MLYCIQDSTSWQGTQETLDISAHSPNRPYTISGEMLRGIQIIDRIVAAARDQADNALEPITMTVTVKE